jgi:hypothetical protein
MRRVWGIGIVVALVVAGVPGTATAANTWVPGQGLRWQYQLQGDVSTTVCSKPVVGPKHGPCVRPDVYDIDLYNNDGTALNSAAVQAIHAAGAHAVCYVDAGTWENWRPDQNQFPASALGKSNGWPGEKWLDIRRPELAPILDARVAKCASAGFDAVEFDNVDGYTNSTGFPLTAADQLTFDQGLAAMAHSHNLSVGLKNDLDQLGALQNDFDFAINEQCFQYQECGTYSGWLAAGKAVVEVEYKGSNKKFCADAIANDRDAMRKSLSLKAKPYTPCR